MENSTTALVLGIGNVKLKFTSGGILTLTNVFYVPKVRKNLVSGDLLNKFGFKLVLEADKFVLSKGVCLLEMVIFVMVCLNSTLILIKILIFLFIWLNLLSFGIID